MSFGTERVKENVSVQPFFAPDGNLEIFVDGTTPVSIEELTVGRFITSSPPFGPTFVGEVPLIESVPGALDASTEYINVTIGAAYRQGRKTTYYETVPKQCPNGGFPLKTEMTFLGGATAEALYKAPCPKR